MNESVAPTAVPICFPEPFGLSCLSVWKTRFANPYGNVIVSSFGLKNGPLPNPFTPRTVSCSGTWKAVAHEFIRNGTRFAFSRYAPFAFAGPDGDSNVTLTGEPVEVLVALSEPPPHPVATIAATAIAIVSCRPPPVTGGRYPIARRAINSGSSTRPRGRSSAGCGRPP